MSYEPNIKLNEAMTIPITQSIRVWMVSGLHVEVQDLPKNVTTFKTLVMKMSDGRFAVGVQWNVVSKEPKTTVENPVKFSLSFDEGPGTYIKTIAKISTIEELQDKFPRLFELEGDLFTLR